ncbi:hypothetical protein PF050_17225 [Kosakonia pseudosacchari]|uniref:hypothetical protein n=1 Tax=Kosakonia pseudosacchari TaxID=1646340 RepID=UPI0022F09CB9|nr:hypothetical protein [Kosakonia pseudosacchari]WBU48193.1 hypothetical protein PF050_17225 [Kosakonia pseudosacchari]
MKYSLLLLLVTFISSVRADEAVKLHCPTRGNLTVSFFDYNLITMKWSDHFQVAAGKERSKTKAGVPFWSTTFGNGDNLAFFPDSGQYFLFYAGAQAPEQCSEVGSFVYPVITPPRYDKNAATPQSQASTIDKDVILLHPAT